MARKHNFFLDALPISLTFISISIAFGISGREMGLSLFTTTLMSVIVYAGGSQMIAMGLILTGEPITAIVVTTFVVNLRHLLMSAALSPKVSHWPLPLRIAFGAELTDESFSLLSTRFAGAPLPMKYAFGVNTFCHVSWVLGTILGHALSGLIVDIQKFGLDYALIAMLVALLALQVRTLRKLAVAIVSGAVAVVGFRLGIAHLAVILATVVGATLGLIWEKRYV